MPDDTAIITFDNDQLSNENGSVSLNGRIEVDYTTKDYSGTYSVNGMVANTSGRLAVAGGFVARNGKYSIDDGTLAVSWNDEQPTVALNESFNSTGSNGIAPGRYIGSDQPLTSVACYVRGTLIETIQGQIAIENLVAGDRVITAFGAKRPICWIGVREYSGRFASRNPALLPIRFAAGSLGGGLPRRDLLVSPKHAMVLDGMLVPAELLVNGRSITRVERVESLAYYHVELDSHDVLLAEGAASESYVADNNRSMFQNADKVGRLNDKEAFYCLPRIEAGFALLQLRHRLLDQAIQLSDTASKERSSAA